jgi:hypothetical protein
MIYSNSYFRKFLTLLAAWMLSLSTVKAEEVGSRWGTEER